MPPSPKVAVRLSAEDRALLERVVRTGEHPALVVTRARILLKADADGPDAWPDDRIADALDVCRMTVRRARQRFAAEGLDATLRRKKPTGRQYRKLDGAQEARLVQIACSEPPAGRARWTMRLLADRLVELNTVRPRSCYADDSAFFLAAFRYPSSSASVAQPLK